MSTQDIFSIMSAVVLIGSLDSLLQSTLFFIFKKDNTLQLTSISQDSILVKIGLLSKDIKTKIKLKIIDKTNHHSNAFFG